MGVFFGLHKYNLDGKNRLILPVYFRNLLKKEKAKYFMLALGFNKCLYLFLPSQWEKISQDNLSIFKSSDKEKERAFKRFFFGNAVKAEVDKLGRVLVNTVHKKYAGLKKKIIVVGVGNKAEIWDANQWEKYNRKVIIPNKEKFSKIYDI
ncbi:MAG TPA: division/cell wall cluster transcriptional repressor MraZ [Elusimicrobiales bacterium]|nr:division/cell wall cluster transcriptional repressor MraZ [Elusimicrobiales bacterium]